jgi:hypothetical protein
MPPAAKPAPQQDQTLKYLGWGAGLLAALFCLLPGIVAGVVFWPLRGRLARRDWAVMLAGGLLATAVGGALASYATWFGGFVRDENRFAVPVVAVICLGLIGAGATGLLQGTAVAAKIPLPWRKNAGGIAGKNDIVPTDAERERIAVVAPPVLHADPTLHSVTSALPVGERPFPIGVDRYGRPVMLSEKEIETHGLIFGATGSGKSKTLETIMGGLLDLGWDGMLLDLKEDTKPGGLRDWCNEYAAVHARPYQELRLSDPSPQFWFDPLAGLGQDEARDAILSLTRFDDEFYQNVCKAMLGQLLKLMYLANKVDPKTFRTPTIAEIARILSSASLPASTKLMRGVVQNAMPQLKIDDEMHMLARPDQTEVQQAKSWGYKLGNTLTTQAGSLVLSPSEHRRLIDVTAPGLIYVGLDSQGKQDLTRMVSAAMLQRLSADAAARTTGQAIPTQVAEGAQQRNQGAQRRKFLIVDEANWVDRTIVQNLLSRARSAGISMILCTQGPLDWRDRDGDDFGKLAQNTNVAIFMRQGETESAIVCADYIGKERFMQRTYGAAEDELLATGTVREAEDHIVTPDQLRNLRIGEAVMRVGAPQTRTQWMKISMRDPKLVVPQATPGAQPAGLARPPL